MLPVKKKFSSKSPLLRVWLTSYSEAKDVKPGTVRVRLHEISKLIPYFGQLKLKDITREMYQDALNDLNDQGYSVNTREGIHVQVE